MITDGYIRLYINRRHRFSIHIFITLEFKRNIFLTYSARIHPVLSLMEGQKITLIKQLQLGNADITIKVSVIRTWKLKDFDKKGEFFAMDMILMDETGTKIQSRLLKGHFPKFMHLLQEGSAVYINSPSVVGNNDKFRNTDQMNKLNFTWKTRITKCMDFFGSTHGFSFADHDSINSQTIPHDISFDLMGVIMARGTLDTTDKDKSKHRLEIHIQDLKSVEVKVTLWGDCAYQYDDFVKRNTDNVETIVIVQLARLAFWNGCPSASTNYDASKLFINDDIAEIIEFRQSLLTQNGNASSSSTVTLLQSNNCSEHDDFLKLHEFKSIADLLVPTEVKKVVIVGTIIRIEQDKPWYYLACTKCLKRADEIIDTGNNGEGSNGVEKKSVYQCLNEDCNKFAVSFVPRFKIPLIVKDEFGTSVGLTLFEKDAVNLFGKSSRELVRKMEQLDLSLALFPDDINVLKGQKLAFKIQIKDYNVNNQQPSYSICRVSQDETIISHLENKNKNATPDNSVSLNGDSLDFGYEGTKVIKDILSESGDNITPSTVEQDTTSTLRKKSSTSAELKRKLVDVYDLEEDEHLSATKTKRPSPTNGSPHKLLVPKIEK